MLAEGLSCNLPGEWYKSFLQLVRRFLDENCRLIAINEYLIAIPYLGLPILDVMAYILA